MDTEIQRIRKYFAVSGYDLSHLTDAEVADFKLAHELARKATPVLSGAAAVAASKALAASVPD